MAKLWTKEDCIEWEKSVEESSRDDMPYPSGLTDSYIELLSLCAELANACEYGCDLMMRSHLGKFILAADSNRPLFKAIKKYHTTLP